MNIVVCSRSEAGSNARSKKETQDASKNKNTDVSTVSTATRMSSVLAHLGVPLSLLLGARLGLSRELLVLLACAASQCGPPATATPTAAAAVAASPPVLAPAPADLAANWFQRKLARSPVRPIAHSRMFFLNSGLFLRM